MKLERFLYSKYVITEVNFYEMILSDDIQAITRVSSVRSTIEKKIIVHIRHCQRQQGIRGQFVDRLCSLTNWQTVVCNFWRAKLANNFLARRMYVISVMLLWTEYKIRVFLRCTLRGRQWTLRGTRKKK